ncbi:MAG: VCBS repeat-containing protein [Planctomycetes bacterium]|nr:VCBS repeat-containing protein [Planctomycetota bacterium]
MLRITPHVATFALMIAAPVQAGPVWRNMILTVDSVETDDRIVVGTDERTKQTRRLHIPDDALISRLVPTRRLIGIEQLVEGDRLICRADVSGDTPRVTAVRVTTEGPVADAPSTPRPAAVAAPKPQFMAAAFEAVDIEPSHLRWAGASSRRVLVEVPPTDIGTREVDDAPAAVVLDILERFKLRIDGRSVQVMRVDPTSGEPMPCDDWAYRRSAFDRPHRWYDAAIPFDYPQVIAGISRTDDQPRRTATPGFGYQYASVGDGKAGKLAFIHTQQARQPSYYAIYFDLLDDQERYEPGPRGWLGDGQVRCEQTARYTFATGHVRIDLVDFDGDGLTDIITGDQNGQLMWLANLGEPDAPRFKQARLINDADGRPIDVGIHAAPLVVDWNDDGVEDLLVGTYTNRIAVYRNHGESGDWRLRFHDVLRIDGKPLELPISPIVGRDESIFQHDYYPVLDTADVDGDGDADLLAGGYVTGRIYLYENNGRDDDGWPALTFCGPFEADGKPINVGDWCAAPEVIDLNGDGLPDLLSGAHAMTPEGTAAFRALRCYQNVGATGAWRFREIDAPLEGEMPTTALGTLRVADMTADGLPDLVFSGGRNIWLLKNVGSETAPRFRIPQSPIQLKWGTVNLPGNYFVDYNDDGMIDAVSRYHVNCNSGRGNPYFFDDTIDVLPADVTIRHDSGIGDDWFWPRLADFDGDGDWDILFGDWFGHVWLHANNAGTYDLEGEKLADISGAPLRVGPETDGDVSDFTALQGARTVFVVGDFDGDDVNDLVLGDTFGKVYYAHNVGTADRPGFESLVEIGDLGRRLLVDATDWNADGRLDVLAGSANGRVRVFLNNGKKGAAAFADGFDPNLPPILQPRVLAVDLNNDGDDDIFSPSLMGSIWVERSFLRQGYAPGRILHIEARPE